MLEYLTRPTKPAAYALLVAATLFWAGNYTVGRWAAGHVPPVTLAFLRWTGAALLVLPLAAGQLRNDWSTIRANAGLLLALGVTGAGLFNTLQYVALTQTTATNAGIINSSSPVMIALLSYFINAERLRARQIAGISLSLIGVVTVIAKAELETLTSLTFNAGDLIMLVAMAFWALYTALLEKRPAVHALSFAAVTYVIACLLNAPAAGMELAGGAHIHWSWATVAAIAYTAVFPSFLAFLFFNRGVEILGPARSGAFLHLVPLFVAGMAVMFLGEQPGLHHAAGLALILVGISLAARPPEQKAT